MLFISKPPHSPGEITIKEAYVRKVSNLEAAVAELKTEGEAKITPSLNQKKKRSHSSAINYHRASTTFTQQPIIQAVTSTMGMIQLQVQGERTPKKVIDGTNQKY